LGRTFGSAKVEFKVNPSVPIAETFDKWDATLTFTSPELATGVLDIKIQADSVNTGSGVKDGKLKSKDFFDVKDDPYITSTQPRSRKLVQPQLNSREISPFVASRRPKS
jgi:polyisoprenoid-binding protein YceI